MRNFQGIVLIPTQTLQEDFQICISVSLSLCKVFCAGRRLIKNDPRYDSKDFSKIFHGERG